MVAHQVFNSLDYVLMIVIVILGMVSAIKGFFKEVLGTLSLVISFLICFYVGSMLNDALLSIVKIQIIASFLSYILLFLLSMFTMNHFLLKIFSNINVNKGLDILLGFTLGVLKAIVFISICFFCLDFIWVEQYQPQFLQTSVIKNTFYNFQNKINIKDL